MNNKVLAPTLSHAEWSRTLLEQARSATLSTISLSQEGLPAGYPFGSLVNFASEISGDIILFTSNLAEHTHNFKVDGRASLMVAEKGLEDPLTGGRLTLMGDIGPAPDREEARALYLESNPEAGQYVDFPDFHFYRLTVKSVRYVGGFGRMSWVDLGQYRQARPDPIMPYGPGIISHMNEDHADSMLVMCQHQAQVQGSEAHMTQVDRYGFDINLTTEEGPLRVRLGFSKTLTSIDEVRPEMVSMVRRARES